MGSATQKAGSRYTASLLPDRQAVLAFKVTGYVTGLLQVRVGAAQRAVQPGDEVEKGAVLAQLNPASYRTAELQALAGLEATRALRGASQQASESAADRVKEAQSAATVTVQQQHASVVTARQAKAAVAISQQLVRAAQISHEQALYRAQAAEESVTAAAALQREAASRFMLAKQVYARASYLYNRKSLPRADYDRATAQVDSAKAAVSAAAAQAASASAQQQEAAAAGRAAAIQVTQALLAAEQARDRLVLAQISADSAHTQSQAANAAVARARAGRRGAQYSALASAASEQQARSNLMAAAIPVNDTRLKAPFAGMILARKIDIGDLVVPAAPAVVLADTTHMRVVFGVPDSQLQQLKPGMVIPVQIEGEGDRRYDGVVYQIDAAADPTTRVFQIQLRLSNESQELKPGMIATVELGKSSPANAVLVSISSLVPAGINGSGFAVAALQEASGITRIHMEPVAVGAVYGDRITVTGIAAGTRIVANGASLMRDGEKVTLSAQGDGSSHAAR
jgi:RND family efflux transporter MFP subunit